MIATDWKIANRAEHEGFEPLVGLNRWWEALEPSSPYQATTREEWADWQQELRIAVADCLGAQPHALALAPRMRAEGTFDGGIRFRFGEVDTAEGVTVPFLVLIPPGVTAPTAGVLCIHGHGDGMNPLVGLNAAGEPIENEYQHAFALAACRKGFVVLTFDMLCFGRRRDFARAGHCRAPRIRWEQDLFEDGLAG